jgi:hypothetical protein
MWSGSNGIRFDHRPSIVRRLIDATGIIDATINFEPLPPLSATPTIMIICTKIVVFLIVGEADDSPNKLKFCWRHNKVNPDWFIGTLNKPLVLPGQCYPQGTFAIFPKTEANSHKPKQPEKC